MNKIKFNLISNSFLDETCIVNILLNNNTIAENVEIQTSENSLVYDVANFENLNSIKIDALNKFNNYELINVSESNGVKSLSIDSLGGIEDLVLLLSSVSISTDNGETWKEITPGTDNNPQVIISADFESNLLIQRYYSEFYKSAYLCFTKDSYFGKNTSYLFYENQIKFFFSLDSEINCINDIVIDAPVQKAKTSRLLPSVSVCLLSQENFTNLVNTHSLEAVSFSPQLPFTI